MTKVASEEGGIEKFWRYRGGKIGEGEEGGTECGRLSKALVFLSPPTHERVHVCSLLLSLHFLQTALLTVSDVSEGERGCVAVVQDSGALCFEKPQTV